MTEKFRRYIKDESRGQEINIFAFLGYTFNNPNQVEIAESLQNLMWENDLLWIDLPSNKDIDKQLIFNNIKNRYISFLDSEEENALTFIGIMVKKVWLV